MKLSDDLKNALIKYKASQPSNVIHPSITALSKLEERETQASSASATDDLDFLYEILHCFAGDNKPLEGEPEHAVYKEALDAVCSAIFGQNEAANERGEPFKGVIDVLLENNLLTPDIFSLLCILRAEQLDQMQQVLNAANRIDVLDSNFCDYLSQNPHAIKVMSDIENLKLFNKELVDYIRNDSRVLAQLVSLRYQNLLTEEGSLKYLLNYIIQGLHDSTKCFSGLIDALKHLKQIDLLNDKYIKIITQSEQAYFCSLALKELKHAGLLEEAGHYLGQSADSILLAKGLIGLNKHNLLTAENVKILRLYATRSEERIDITVKAMHVLASADLLTLTNLKNTVFWQSDEVAERLVDSLIKLNNNKLLTQANLNKMVESVPAPPEYPEGRYPEESLIQIDNACKTLIAEVNNLHQPSYTGEVATAWRDIESANASSAQEAEKQGPANG